MRSVFYLGCPRYPYSADAGASDGLSWKVEYSSELKLDRKECLEMRFENLDRVRQGWVGWSWDVSSAVRPTEAGFGLSDQVGERESSKYNRECHPPSTFWRQGTLELTSLYASHS